jgi:hypothetical protein
MNTITKFGLAALAAGAFFVGTLPSQAETPDATFAFTKHGLPVPGAYFKNKENQQPATIAVSKSGQGIGQEQQTTSKGGTKQTKHVRRTNGGS